MNYIFLLEYADGSTAFYYVVNESLKWDFYNLENEKGLEFSITKTHGIVNVMSELYKNNNNITNIDVYRMVAELKLDEYL